MTAIITEFQFDQFGSGNPLRVLDLGNGLNVALAHSERGQVQLLNVIPFTLYGRFVVPNAMSTATQDSSSAVLLRTDNGVFTVQRSWSDGNVRVLAADGSEFGKKKMRSLLDDIGYKKYRSIFTFSLRRLAQFSTGEENDYLVRMADYLRRKSPAIPIPMPAPVTAIPELRNVYTGLGELTALIQKEVNAPENGQKEEPRDRAKLNRDLKKVEATLTDGRAKVEHLESELDETRAALSLNRAQANLAQIDHELSRLQSRPDQEHSEVGTRNSLDRLVGKIDDCKLQLQELKEEYNEIRRQTRDASNGRRGTKSIAQIEAMLLHEKSLIKEEEAVEQLKLQLQDTESRLEHERSHVASDANELSHMNDSQARARLDGLAERLRDAERELEVAEQLRVRAQTIPLTATGIGLPSVGSHPEDAVAMHEAEQNVLRLRERLGMDDQLGQLEAERADLMLQLRRLYRDQLLPFPIVMALGVPFMIGVGMVIYGLFMNNGQTNWQFVLFGLAISLFTSLIKMSMDRGSSEMLDAARNNMLRIDHQIEQFAGTRDGETTGAIQNELEMAERHLAELQTRFTPAATVQHASYEYGEAPSIETAQLQLNNAHQRVRDLQHDWQELLTQLGLPTSLTPSAAREAIADRAILAARSHGGNEYDQLNNKSQQLRHELDRRQDWLNVLGDQARHLVKEMSVSGGTGSMVEQFDALRDALREAREASATRKQLARNLKRLRQKRDQVKENGRRYADQHRRLLDELKLKKERFKSKHVLENERVKLLQEQRERLEAEIQEIRDRFGLETSSTLAEKSDDELEQRLQEQLDTLEKLRAKLLKQSEQRGRLRALMSSDAPQVDDSRAVFQALRQRTEQLANQLKATAKQAELEAQSKAQAAQNQYQYEYLQRAGNYLSDLSDGDFGRIELLETDPGLGLVNQHGQLIPLDHVDSQHYPNLYFALWLRATRIVCRSRLSSARDRGRSPRRHQTSQATRRC